MKSNKKNNVMKQILRFLLMNVGVVIFAIGIYFFTTPNGFAIGGIGGLSIVLSKFTQTYFNFGSQAVYMAVINTLLLVLGVIFLGKKCGFLTIYCSLLLSAVTLVFEQFIPITTPTGTLTDNPLLELIYVIVCISLGSVILFRCDASSGGTDIIALIMRKYTKMNVSVALLLSDILIVLSTFFVYNIQTGLFATIGLFAKTFVVEDLMDSLNMCKAFTIITTKPDEICECIMNEIQHGATMYDAKGVYTGNDRKVIVTVCRRAEASKLRRRVSQIDPDAFLILTKTSEIMGKGFMDINS